MDDTPIEAYDKDRPPQRPPMFDGMLNKKKHRGTTPWYVVVPVMLIVGAVIGLKVCRAVERDERRHQGYYQY